MGNGNNGQSDGGGIGQGEYTRGDRGQFGKGNHGGPGRGRGLPAIVRYRQAISDAFSQDEVLKVLRMLHGKACMGDTYAAKEFLDRVLGKPINTYGLETDIGDRVPIRIIFDDRTAGIDVP